MGAWADYTYDHETSVPELTVNFNSWSSEDDAATTTEATVHNPRLYYDSSKSKWNNHSQSTDIAYDADGFYYIYQPGTARQLPTGDDLAALCYVVSKAMGTYPKYNNTSSTITSPATTINGLTANNANTTDWALEIHAPRDGYVRMLVGTDSNAEPSGGYSATLTGATTGSTSVNYLAADATYDVKTKSGTSSFSTITYTSAGKKLKSLAFNVNSGTTTITMNPAAMSNSPSTSRKLLIYAIEVYLDSSDPVDPVFSIDPTSIAANESAQIKVGSKDNLDGITLSEVTITDFTTGDASEIVTVNTTTGVVTPSASGKVNITIKSGSTAKYNAETSGQTLTLTITAPKCATPSITPTDGSSFISANQEIAISCATGGAAIYYTLDGTNPNSSSTLYNPEAKPTIDATTTVKAIAIKGGIYEDSEISSATITKVNSITMSNFTSSSIATSPSTTDLGITLSGSEWGKSEHAGEIKFRWGGNSFTIASASHNIVALELTYTTDGDDPIVSVNTGSYNAVAKMWSGSASSIAFTNSATSSNGNAYISKIVVYYEGSSTVPYVAISIGEYEWATFVSDKALDFTGSAVEAFVVTGHSGAALDKTGVTTVAANTPLLLNAPEGDYYIPIVASGTDYSSTNKLKAGTGTAVSAESGKTKYVLSVVNSQAAFKLISTDSPEVPTGNAYLQFDEEIELAPSIIRIVDEENNATNLSNIETADEAVKFIQNGQLFIKRNGVVYDAMGHAIR